MSEIKNSWIEAKEKQSNFQMQKLKKCFVLSRTKYWPIALPNFANPFYVVAQVYLNDSA